MGSDNKSLVDALSEFREGACIADTAEQLADIVGMDFNDGWDFLNVTRVNKFLATLANAIADRIKAEYTELPRDADGVVIRPGDDVYCTEGAHRHGVAGNLVYFGNRRETECWVKWDGDPFQDNVPVTELTHANPTKPDSWERLESDLANGATWYYEHVIGQSADDCLTNEVPATVAAHVMRRAKKLEGVE